MIVGVLAPIAVLGAIALVVILFLQRGRDGLDLSPRNILRLYLYIASLAGIVVLAIGAASAVNSSTRVRPATSPLGLSPS